MLTFVVVLASFAALSILITRLLDQKKRILSLEQHVKNLNSGSTKALCSDTVYELFCTAPVQLLFRNWVLIYWYIPEEGTMACRPMQMTLWLSDEEKRELESVLTENCRQFRYRSGHFESA